MAIYKVTLNLGRGEFILASRTRAFESEQGHLWHNCYQFVLSPAIVELSAESEAKILPGAMYECARCGTPVSGEELAKLPSPTCGNCGYRTFRKVRGNAAKTLKAE